MTVSDLIRMLHASKRIYSQSKNNQSRRKKSFKRPRQGKTKTNKKRKRLP